MFVLFILLLFGWLFFVSLRLIFRVTWGLTKLIAVVLFILSLPLLIIALLLSGGFLLLLPVLLVLAAFGLLKSGD